MLRGKKRKASSEREAGRLVAMTTRRAGETRRAEERRDPLQGRKKSRGWRVGVVSGQSTSSSPHIMDFRFWSMSLSSSSSVLPLLGLVERWTRGVVKGGVGRRGGSSQNKTRPR